MKKCAFFLLLIATVGFSSVATFAQCESSRLSQIQCGYYNEGYKDGTDDARTNRASDYRRYRNKPDSQLYERYYIQGYDAGFISVRPAQNRFPGSGRGNGNGRGGRGSQTGTVTWSGRVDNRVNIVIRGNEVTNQQVAGAFSPDYQNMDGVLPRRNSTISVNKLQGRGTAFVIQQPAQSNDYTAVVQVSDPQRSDDEYRLEIRWQSESANVDDRYNAGRLTWRGRVDQRVNVVISGSDVESTDESRSGLKNVGFDINGYLAARAGNVSVRKRRGRGTVTVLQQPDRNNNYEAIIQIYDEASGDDDYEIEVTW